MTKRLTMTHLLQKTGMTHSANPITAQDKLALFTIYEFFWQEKEWLQ